MDSASNPSRSADGRLDDGHAVQTTDEEHPMTDPKRTRTVLISDAGLPD